MNITLVAFRNEKRDRDGDLINYAEQRVLHPESVEAAAVDVEGLALEAEERDGEEWDVLVLFDGREAESDEQLAAEDAIQNPGKAARAAAQERRRLQRLKDEQARRERQRRVEEAACRRREQAEWEQYLKLKAKYEGSGDGR